MFSVSTNGKDYLYFEKELVCYTIEKGNNTYYLFRTDIDKSYDHRLDKEVMIMHDDNIMVLIDYIVKDK